MLLVFQGRFAEADEQLRLAQEENPYSAGQIRVAIQARLMEARYTQAIDLARQLLTRDPTNLFAKNSIDLAHALEGRPDLALADFQKLEGQVPQAKAYEAQALACEGRREEALRLMRPFEEHYRTSGVPLVGLAALYAFLGDEDNTVKWQHRSANDHEWIVLTIGVAPIYSRVRNGPKFQALLKRIGLKP